MISVKEMKNLEEMKFASGTTIDELMEVVGEKCAKQIESKLGIWKKIIIFCGPGNNGGDGLVAARYLAEKNDVAVIVSSDSKTEPAKKNLEKAKKAGVKFLQEPEKCDIIVDALLGFGFKGELRGNIKEACKIINSMKAYKVSIDIPTGIDSDSGEYDADFVKVDATICLHDAKIGAIKAGKERTGELWIIDIGL
jgi:NAD(P)H-hydrate epimerase